MRDRARALIVLIGVFLLGCILGISGSYFWFAKYAAPRYEARVDGPPSPRGRPRVPEFLKMTTAQESQFREIMMESRRQLDTLQTEQWPKIEAVLDAANKKIYSILDPQQKIKFDEYMKDMKKHRSRDPRGGRFGHPPGPGFERGPRMGPPPTDRPGEGGMPPQ